MLFSKKILYLGANIPDTDLMVAAIAKQNGTINHGLVSSNDFVPTEYGLYHTTVIDIAAGAIVKMSKHFDSIEMLDQPKSLWPHWKSFLATYKVMCEIETLGLSTVFRQNQGITEFSKLQTFLEQNKSFCIYPWINVVMENSKQLRLCARSHTVVTTIDKLEDWKTNDSYSSIRNKMLRGELLADECKVCYKYENVGAESYRQFETREWINQLGITNIDDLEQITSPYYYEIRLSNKCNVMCRGCRPSYSHLIDKEFKKFNIKPVWEEHIDYSDTSVIDIKSLTHKHRVYLTGGEPTIINEVMQFMQRCIDLDKTDFEFTLSTNAEKLSPKFLRLSEHFTNMNFSISLDAYKRINDYWRWGTHWDNVISNMKLLEKMNHNISINCVIGIYNITNLHLLYEFLDKEFPNTSVYLQINHYEHNSPFNHPNAALVLDSLEKCKKTHMYFSDGKSNKTLIDSFYEHYSNDPVCNIENLKKFFDYNDQLDRARNSQLGDYIPELEECRKYIQ